MVERVVPVELGVMWDPNVPSAVLVTGDDVGAVLAVRSHPDDADQRDVALVWDDVHHAAMGGPNDEGIGGHRLWRRGLDPVLWAGVVEDSELVRWIGSVSAVTVHRDGLSNHPLVHHVLLLKGCVVEVVASRLRVERRAGGSTLASAVLALG